MLLGKVAHVLRVPVVEIQNVFIGERRGSIARILLLRRPQVGTGFQIGQQRPVGEAVPVDRIEPGLAVADRHEDGTVGIGFVNGVQPVHGRVKTRVRGIEVGVVAVNVKGVAPAPLKDGVQSLPDASLQTGAGALSLGRKVDRLLTAALEVLVYGCGSALVETRGKDWIGNFDLNVAVVGFSSSSSSSCPSCFVGRSSCNIRCIISILAHRLFRDRLTIVRRRIAVFF